MFEEYLISFHSEDLLEILANPENSKCLSININFIELHERKIELANALLREPEAVLEEWDKAALSAQMALIKQQTTKCELKIKVHCRIHYLAHLARHSSVFPGNKDAGKFLQISGTVMHITAPKLLEYQRSYVCVKCKSPAIVKAIFDRKYIIKQPVKCQNPEGCDGTNLVHFGGLDSENCKDYQEIKIQEQVKKLGMGTIPNTIWVTLEDDLVDSCQPGDDVTVCGIVKRRFGEFIIGKRPEIDLVVKANHVQVDTNSSLSSVSTPETLSMFKKFFENYADNPLEGRNIILKSYCPQIYGLYPVKLAIAVILAGGCSTQDGTLTGVRTRSESHLLLVGDPGTGKSQLLKFAAKVIPRSVLTTGIGSTAAGLTVTATMERGEWQLEAGALVLADGGICCIDEFNSMKEHDRTSIHEAMEQQTISVAKASIVCKLNTRCSILAACNPKGNLDPKQPLPMNVALPSPLLSRFDLIMMLRDTVNQEWDERVIDYILNDGHNISKLTDFGLWPVNILQTYFKLIKKLQPKLTEDAETILSTYYNIQRRMTSRNKARTTVRLLESLVRLSQGHARLMYHEKVLVIDSIYAVFLVDISMGAESSLFDLDMAANSIFPEKTKSSYRTLLETVLSKMQLFDILEKEWSKLSVSGEGPLLSRFFKNPTGNANRNAEINSNNEAERITEENSNLKSQDICNSGKVETSGTENQPTDGDNNCQFSNIEINKSASATENNKQSDCDNNKTKNIKNIDKSLETENKALTDIDNNQVPNSSDDADKIENIDMPSTSEHKKQSKTTNVDLPSSTEDKKRSLHDKGPVMRDSKNSNKRSKTCTSSLDSVQNDLDVLKLIPSNIHLDIDCGTIDVPSGSNCASFSEKKTENFFDDLNSVEGIDFDL